LRLTFDTTARASGGESCHCATYFGRAIVYGLPLDVVLPAPPTPPMLAAGPAWPSNYDAPKAQVTRLSQ